MIHEIRLPKNIYKRLEQYSLDFETPVQVINTLLNFYETENIGEENMVNFNYDHEINMELLETAFNRVFDAKPRKFGQKSNKICGFSDNAKGVQWNIGLVSLTGNIKLGVNLEGMSYSNSWPISKFIQNELRNSELIKQFGNNDDITVRFNRDVWQVSARLPVEENIILRSNLSNITQETWKGALSEALACLNSGKQYKGRTTQKVTLLSSGKTVAKEVSPHICFKVKVSPKNTTLEAVCDAIEKGRAQLLDIYKFMKFKSE